MGRIPVPHAGVMDSPTEPPELVQKAPRIDLEKLARGRVGCESPEEMADLTEGAGRSRRLMKTEETVRISRTQ